MSRAAWQLLSNEHVNRHWMSDPHAGAIRAGDAQAISLAQGLLLFALVTVLGNELGSVVRYPEAGAAVLFPPYAFLTAALVVSERRHWIWYVLIAAVAHFATNWPQWSLTWVMVADAANLSRALIAAILLRWIFGGPPRLESIRSLALFIGVAAIIAPAVAATIGASNVLLHGTSQPYVLTWSAWYMSNALTGLTLLPALILAIDSRTRLSRRYWTRQHAAEVIVLTLALIASAIVPHFWATAGSWPPGLLFYAPLPALLWSAIRFGPTGATASLTLVAFGAIWGSAYHAGPFASASPDERVFMLQLFVLLTAIPVLCVAVTSSARDAVVQLHRALLASLHDHIAILDGRGVVLEVNDSWRRFAASDDVASYKRVLVGDDYLDALRRAAEHGDQGALRVLPGVTDVLNRVRDRFEVEYDLDRSGHQERYQLSVEALERADGGVILRRTDLTARRQAQLEVEEQRRVVSHLARVAVLGQLSGALAHELNQPLTAIASNAEAALLLLRQRPRDLLEIEAILRDIAADDQRAAQVIRRLRALLKRGETRLQSTDTNELVGDVLELARMEMITRGVTATTQVGPNVPPVLGDRVQLQQVLLNLILNACEAMATTPPAERRLELIVNADSLNNVRFSVRDRGTGIAPALMERLFEPFVTTKAEGLGLGLSMSRTIIAAHGGRMWAENNPDRGVTMHFLLSASVADESLELVPDYADKLLEMSVHDAIASTHSLAAQPVTMSSE